VLLESDMVVLGFLLYLCACLLSALGVECVSCWIGSSPGIGGPFVTVHMHVKKLCLLVSSLSSGTV
jgi:hypothetical protein